MSDNPGLILHITAAGREQRMQARLQGLPLPRFTAFAVDSASQADIDNPVMTEIFRSGDPSLLLVEPLDEVAIGVRILIPATFAGWVRGLALIDDSGTVYAYARYAAENNGMYKPIGVAIRQLLVFAEDGRDKVEFIYGVMDVGQLRDTVIAAIDVNALRQQVLTGIDINALRQQILGGIDLSNLAQQVAGIIGNTGGSTQGDITCATLAALLKTHASVDLDTGTIVFDCDSTGGGTGGSGTGGSGTGGGDYTTPSASLDPTTGIVTIVIDDATAIYLGGVMTVTDTVAETYAYTTPVFTTLTDGSTLPTVDPPPEPPVITTPAASTDPVTGMIELSIDDAAASISDGVLIVADTTAETYAYSTPVFEVTNNG